MNTQNKKPNIRFNQFKELWKVVKLDSISQKVKSKNINNSFENVLTNSAEFGIVPQRDFFDKDIANLKSLSGYYVVQPNDFVYNPRISNKAPVGPIKANFLNITGVISPLYYVFRTQNIDVFFLAKYFDSSYWHKFMKLNGDTGARSDRFAIKDSVFKEMPIPFPSLAEQSAISTFFRNLDDLLSSYKDNLANYQSLKATMLSQMFPKAGQTVPEIRLNGFDDEWEVQSLKELASFSKGNGYTKSDLVNSGNEIILYGQLYTNYQTVISMVNTFVLETREKSVISKGGEVVVPASGESAEDISRASVIEKSGVIIGGDLNIIYPDENKVDSIFLALTISNGSQQKELIKRAQGKSVVHLRNNDLEKVVLHYPSMEEQRAIGDYFSNLDKLISSYQEKITQLEILKKKLLQDMFI